MKHNLDFYTSYNQFYLCDSKSPQNINAKDFWNDQAYSDRIAMGNGIIAVRTQSYGHIIGELQFLNKESEVDNYDLYDHVVDAGIEIKSNTLQILDCPNGTVEKEIKIIPGLYKIRIYSKNIEGVDGDENEGNDSYKIEIWKSTNLDKKVLKQISQL